MSTLYATKLWCSEETDEVGFDDIYLVVFVGRPSAPSFVVCPGPGDYWDSMETGDKRNWWIKIYENYNPENLHLVALMEKDSGKDIAGLNAKLVEARMVKLYKDFTQAIPSASNDDLAQLLIPELKDAINDYRTNDERLTTRHVLLGSSGSVWGKFTGDGGKYWVQFTSGSP